MSFVRGENELCVSNEIIDEYLEILQKLTNIEVAEYIVKTIINSPFVVFKNPFYKFDLIQADKDDNKFVDCAIAAQAKCIISNDHHYDILSTIPFPHVEVINRRVGHPCPTHSAFIYSRLSGSDRDAIPSYGLLYGHELP